MSNRRRDQREPLNTRLGVEISLELRRQLNDKIQWGFLKHVIICLLDDLVQALDQPNGKEVLAKILSRTINTQEIWTDTPEGLYSDWKEAHRLLSKLKIDTHLENKQLSLHQRLILLLQSDLMLVDIDEVE